MWKNKLTLNTVEGSNLESNSETKSIAYSASSFDEICLGMRLGKETKYISKRYVADSLHDVISDGQYHHTQLGRDAWKSLIPGSSLQPHCNKEGFNVYFPHTRVRIGIFSNQENDCNSPDSRIGIGGAGGHCGQNNANSVGNEARCSPDNGDKSIKAVGLVLIKKNAHELGRG